jgi:hypothetical protein
VSAVEARVRQPTGEESAGSSKADEARLASLEAEARALEVSSDKSAKGVGTGTRVSAPFEVIDSHGLVI